MTAKQVFTFLGAIPTEPWNDTKWQRTFPFFYIPRRPMKVEICQCEKLALLDLKVREYKKISRVPLADMINIADAVQGIFDYV